MAHEHGRTDLRKGQGVAAPAAIRSLAILGLATVEKALVIRRLRKLSADDTAKALLAAYSSAHGSNPSVRWCSLQKLTPAGCIRTTVPIRLAWVSNSRC